MINYVKGNLLDSKAEALVNTVNTVGIMGKGVALQFRKEFPGNYKTYLAACKEKRFDIGQLLVTQEESLLAGEKIVINFPTKKHWKSPSEYSYIEIGLQKLVEVIKEMGIRSIAIPPLGAGNGGLEWNKVQALMEKYLRDVDCDISIYTPDYVIQEVLKKERVPLTPARAMLLSVLFELVKNGEFVSEFAAEKITYFLQRFGGRQAFRELDFQQNFYGPYSGKVKHILYYLNGSYITGYSSKDKKPFEEISLMMDAEPEVTAYLQGADQKENAEVVEKTKVFLAGFYSSFGLELLSTIDFIRVSKNLTTLEDIIAYLQKWSERKTAMFAKERFIDVAVKQLQTHLS